MTEYSYDLLNRLEKTTRMHNGTAASVQYFYDETGNRVREINEKGYEKAYGYDSMNRLVSMTDAAGGTYTYAYDLVGNKTSETNPKGDTISYSYDQLSRVVQVVDPYGEVISRKVYDETGNIVKEIDAKGYLSGETDEERYGTEYEYDLAGRAEKIVDPEGGVTNYEYSQYGELIKQTDATGNTTQYEYDIAGKLVTVTDALGKTTRYTYDKAGNKLTMTDGRGKITRYAYGSFGLLTAYTDAEGQETRYKYDLSLAVASMEDRNGNDTRYNYDSRGLLTEKRVEETGDTVSYTYDVLGNRETMTDDTGTSSYSYNENNWLTSIEKDGDLQISYTYDEIGNLQSVTDKLDNITEYTYDKSSRMKTVSFEGRETTYEYDENGNRESISYGGEVEEGYSYDKNNRLLQLTNKKAGAGELSSYSYTYDKAGKRVTKTDSYGTTEYTYDKTGRINAVEAPGKTTVYTYDGAGNRISQDETYTDQQIIPAIDGTGIGEIKYIVKRSEYIYSNASRLLKLVEKMKDAAGKELLQRTTTFRYDSNGNELRRSVEYLSLFNRENPKAYEAAVYSEDTTEPIHAVVDQTTSKYDGFNRLVETELIKATVKTTVEYAYDGDGLRVSKTVRRSDKGNTAETTRYLYDRQHVILETKGSEEIRYVRGINYIARIDSADKLSYYLYNGHGDMVQTISESGEIENQYDFDVFGNPTLTVEEYSNSIRYAGEFCDVETGLYYLRARYYDPYIGRFISEDSYWGEDTNPLSLNLYTYAHNDPIRYIDPSGHSILGAIGGVIGGLLGGSKGAVAGTAAGEALNNLLNNASSKSRNRGRNSGSGNNSVTTPDYSKEAAAIETKAKLKLNGNENSDTLQKMLDSQKKLAEEASQKGNISEAEAYSQNAEVLLKKLQEQQAKEQKVAPRVLVPGYSGDDVRELQHLLNQAGIKQVRINGEAFDLKANGDFGKITLAAVQMYQEKMGLKADGKAGPKTMASLRSLAASNKTMFDNPYAKYSKGWAAEGSSIAGMADVVPWVAGNSGMEPKVTGNGANSPSLTDILKEKLTTFVDGIDMTIGLEVSAAGNAGPLYKEAGMGVHITPKGILQLAEIDKTADPIDYLFELVKLGDEAGYTFHHSTGVIAPVSDIAKTIDANVLKNDVRLANLSLNKGVTLTWDTDNVKAIKDISHSDGASVKAGLYGIGVNYQQDKKDPENGAKSLTISWASGGGYEVHLAEADYTPWTFNDVPQIANSLYNVYDKIMHRK